MAEDAGEGGVRLLVLVQLLLELIQLLVRVLLVDLQEVVVTRVGFRLARGKTDELRLRVRELVGRRKGSQPAGPNAGSMFRNPPGEVAGRLIEHAGLKGTRIGQAEISRRHANFIVNLGGARAADVRKLMELARRSVERMFSIRLETEVRIVGDWRDWSEEERDASRAAG